MSIQVMVPNFGESITEVVMGQWFKKDGDYVEADEAICEIESDKATQEIPAEEAGVIHPRVKEGDTLGVGDLIAEIDTSAERPAESSGGEEPKTKPAETQKADTAPQAPPAPQAAAPEAEPISREGKVRATPVARKLMEEHGLSAATVHGSGPGHKITKQDVLKTVAGDAPPAAAPAAKTTAVAPPPPSAAPGGDGETERPVRRQRMSTLRRTIANRLVAAKNEMAMLTTINEVDMSAVMSLRKRHQEAFQSKYGVKLGFMSFFAMAVCRALEELPAVNALIDGSEIVYHDYIDLGIAVSTPKGLVVPVIRNAGHMTQPELEVAIYNLAERARTGKLTIEEMSGGTFTITNGGVFGSLISTPIINPPQVGVLGMHNILPRPVAVDGQVEIRPMMYIALSYDHRLIDGRESVTFLVRIKEYLEAVGADPLHL